jgi:DNA-binding XRE family transcriptional regulator
MDLKAVREALGITQKDLDRRAGLKIGTVGDIESRRNENPGVRVAIKITRALQKAGALGVDVEGLFQNSRPGKSNAVQVGSK